VNHIFFHGIPYSPAEAPWPGWQFYAAVNFGPQGGLWHDLPEFNAYITRCQSILQSGAPDNDVLIYYPVHDLWNSTGELIRPNPVPKSFTNAVMYLWDHGYAFDYLSDRFLARATSKRQEIRLGQNSYQVILVPQCQVMPKESLQKLVQLAHDGAIVLFQNQLPSDVPGWGNLKTRRAEFQQCLARIHLKQEQGVEQATVGKGAIMVGTNLAELLSRSKAPREPCVDGGLRFIRRKAPYGHNYFFANRGERSFDGWVTLARPLTSALILDPRAGSRIGTAAFKNHFHGEETPGTFYLQLEPGESCIARVFTNRVIKSQAWAYHSRAGSPQEIVGAWKIKFIEGGPQLPGDIETSKLASWTEIGDREAKRFAGTARYAIEFEVPPGKFDDWLLELGRVCDSARVKVNGQEVGGFWCAPYQASVGQWLRPGKNLLEVEVTNLAANRVADLDRRKIKWKYFYDINVASKRYKSFDASDWPPQPSGLLGPVSLTPITDLHL
jgi:hypothetical protein